MKKVILTLFLIVNILTIKAQTKYEYCELVGMQKGLFSRKLIVAVDYGEGLDWTALSDTIATPVAKKVEYKNEKVYVTTDKPIYEGKSVQSDDKGKYIWKKTEINQTINTPITTKVKPKIFESMIDGMNFMGQQGWEFTQAFVVSTNNQSVYHYVLKRVTK